MFEQIFKSPSAISRHREGPLAKERANYLTHLAGCGASRSLLRQTEFYMLAAAKRMKLDETSRLSPNRSRWPPEAGPTGANESHTLAASQARKRGSSPL